MKKQIKATILACALLIPAIIPTTAKAANLWSGAAVVSFVCTVGATGYFGLKAYKENIISHPSPYGIDLMPLAIAAAIGVGVSGTAITLLLFKIASKK